MTLERNNIRQQYTEH